MITITARNKNAPHRSSLGYRRKRASSHKPKVRGWGRHEGPPKILAFPGFKAGMSRIIYQEDRQSSHLAQTDRITAVSIVETPPIILIGLRTYQLTAYGLKILGEANAESENEYLKKHYRRPANPEFEKEVKKVEDSLGKAVQLRAICHTQPDLTSIRSKKPYIFEIKVGTKTFQEGLNWLKEQMGKELYVEDFTREGNYVDVIGITKGKGFQGPVKRHGVTLLPRKSKHTKRGVGSIAPWTPARVQWVLPRYGQLGYFRRTEYNKRVIKLGNNPEQINPMGGFVKYGIVKNRYCVVKGSVPGPKKRLVVLRDPMRAQKKFIKEPTVRYYSRLSQQGAQNRQEVASKW